jgi:putative addiction module component (TIGR02574 family)
MNIKEEIKKLSEAEKILLIEEVWDDIAAERNDYLTEAQKAELDRRLQMANEGKIKYFTLEESRERINRLRKHVHGDNI